MKRKWHKVFVPEGGCATVDSIDNDPMVNWEEEPGYVLLTMVACLEKSIFEDLIHSYDLSIDRFMDVVRYDGRDVWVDVCKAKVKKVWDDYPRLYQSLLEYVRKTDPRIQLGYCTLQGAVQLVVMGNTAKDVSKALARENLPLSNEHFLYIGRELQRLEDCLQHNLIFVQD